MNNVDFGSGRINRKSYYPSILYQQVEKKTVFWKLVKKVNFYFWGWFKQQIWSGKVDKWEKLLEKNRRFQRVYNRLSIIEFKNSQLIVDPIQAYWALLYYFLAQIFCQGINSVDNF